MSSKTGSTRASTLSEDDRGTSVTKLVRQEMMHESEEDLIDRRLSAKEDSLREVMT